MLIFYLGVVHIWKGLYLVLIVGATVVLGRFFCGWICPFGFYMDFITLIRKRLKIRHWTLSQHLNTNLHWLRYIVAFTVLISALPPFLLGAASLLDVAKYGGLRGPFIPYTLFLEPLEIVVVPWVPPFGALLSFGGWSISFPYVGEIIAFGGPFRFAWLMSAVFLVFALTFSFEVRRFWCRFCPTGISIAIINHFSQFSWVPLPRLSKQEEKCTKCGTCKRVCPVQVTEVYERKGGDMKTSMCTLCLRCLEMCPNEGCLKLKVAGKTLLSSSDYLEQKK